MAELKRFLELLVRSIWLGIVDIYLNKSRRYSRKLTESNEKANWLLKKYDEQWGEGNG